MRFALMLLAVGPLAAQDAAEIVRRSVETDLKSIDLVLQYTMLERNEQRQLDSHGKVKERQVKTFDVTVLEGSPYRRLVARNDKPLPPEEEKKEQEKLRHSIEVRKHETPEQRKARLEDAHRREERRRAPIREIPEAFNFRILREDKYDGRDVWVIEATPKPGYRPRARGAFFFPKVRGTFWVAKDDYQWVRAEAVSIETISFGAILARVAKGATIRIEQTQVNNELWLPRRIDIAANARLALVKMWRGQMEVTYSNFRRFQAESRIVEMAPVQGR